MKLKDYKPKDLRSALGWVIEELGEVQQAIGKMERFGWQDIWGGETNTQHYLSEVDDLRRALDEFDRMLNNEN